MCEGKKCLSVRTSRWNIELHAFIHPHIRAWILIKNPASRMRCPPLRMRTWYDYIYYYYYLYTHRSKSIWLISRACARKRDGLTRSTLLLYFSIIVSSSSVPTTGPAPPHKGLSIPHTVALLPVGFFTDSVPVRARVGACFCTGQGRVDEWFTFTYTQSN